MTEHIEKIEQLAQEELTRACAIHGDRFYSLHEAESVIREEIEEAETEFSQVSGVFKVLWRNIKANQDQSIIKTDLNLIRKYAIHAAAELIQVAAMCEKAGRPCDS